MGGVNNKAREVASKSLFESAKAGLTADSTFNQGDLLVIDTSNHNIEKPAAETDGIKFLGVATVSVVAGKLVGPYAGLTDVDAAQAIADAPGPEYGSIYKLVSKTSDAWNFGDNVYLDPATGTRGVSSAGTKSIGVYQGPTIASATAGQEIEVLVGCRYPNDTLKF